VPDANYTPSAEARAASDYYNSLSLEQRRQLAPLLANYRQMGFAEALSYVAAAQTRIQGRIRGIQDA
jgi:hypothetical protein